MYTAYWNLREEPFRNVPDIRFAYLSEQHKEGVARLLYIIRGKKMGGALVGPYGVGKSMVLEMLHRQAGEDPGISIMQLEALPGGTLILARQLVAALGLSGTINNVAEAVATIREHVVQSSRGRRWVLTIDEAQWLGEGDGLMLLHMLTNIRASSPGGGIDTVFTVIVAGHVQLVDELTRQQSLGQRLQLVWKMIPLDVRQTMEYIQHRMRVAGGDIWSFEEAAMTEIHRISGGLPRVINNICDTALMLGYAGEFPKVHRELVLQAARDVGVPAAMPEPGPGGEVKP